MKRFKSIDILRGISMCWMIYGHCMTWWLNDANFWYYHVARAIGDFLGSGNFVFLSGISVMLSYRSRKDKALLSKDLNFSQVRNEYLFRAFFMLLVAFGYNFIVSIMYGNFLLMWNWFVLQTVAVCLFLGWPLLKTHKMVRISLGILLWIGNRFFLEYLLPYEGEASVNGILYYIFYNDTNLDVILSFFTIFLLGTVIGDIVYDLSKIENEEGKLEIVKTKLIIPLFLSGAIMISFGMIYDFPLFAYHRSFSWLFFSVGIDILLFATVFSLDFLGLLETKKSYTFFSYFSYYSFSVYLAHNPLFFVFLRKLDWMWLQPAAFSALIMIGLIIRALYKSKWREYVSIKVQIGILSAYLSRRIIEKKKIYDP
ncbi:MAG: heparan-alpha-glucosaminide N-acetyltransferase domain-containing protein [Promethearchaeota archaeon]